MTCRGKDKTIARYLAGELDEKGRRKIEKHLAECPRCKEAARGLERVTAVLGRLRQEMLPAQLLDAPFRFPELHPSARFSKTVAPCGRFVERFALPLSMAAVVLILGALMAFWLALPNHPQSQPTQRTAREPSAESPAQILPRISAGMNAPHPTRPPKAMAEFQNLRKTAVQPKVPKRGQTTAPEETFVLRLQTDDPGVVVYWQFHGSGGKS